MSEKSKDHSEGASSGGGTVAPLKRTSSDPTRRGSDSSVSQGAPLSSPTSRRPEVDKETIQQVKNRYSNQFLFSQGKRGSESTQASGSTVNFTEDDDALNDLEVPSYILLGEAPSRKGSESSNRRRSASLPENIYSLGPNGQIQARPVHKINFGRSNSMPLITEYGRLASFPSQEYLSTLPLAISERVAGVNQRHSELARKKLVLQARSNAKKERERRIIRRVPYFKSAEEREAVHKSDLPEDDNEIYDNFPAILYLAGFTGVTFTSNLSNKRELGMLTCFPKSMYLSDRTRAILDQVEARKAFAQKKKAEFLKRAHQLRELRKRSVVGLSTDSQDPVSNPLFVRTSTFGENDPQLRSSGADKTLSPSSPRSPRSPRSPQENPRSPRSPQENPRSPGGIRSRRSSRSSIEVAEEVDVKKTSLYITPTSSFQEIKTLDDPEPPETPLVKNFGTVVDGPEGRDFVQFPGEGMGTVRRRGSLPEEPILMSGRKASREETELKLTKWGKDFNQRQQERMKAIAQAPMLPSSVVNNSNRRSSFSILDWKTGSEEEIPVGHRRSSLDNGQKPLPPRAVPIKKDPKQARAEKDRKSATMRKSMSLVREEEETDGGYLASMENLAETPAISADNLCSDSSADLSSASQPENIFAMIKQRRGSLPLAPVEQLKKLAEVRPAAEVIEEINETTTPETPKGSWRISAKHMKSMSFSQQNLENFVATNPLFNLGNLDFTQQTPEKEELFKRKFDTLSKQPKALSTENLSESK